MFKCRFDTDNAAFDHDDGGREVCGNVLRGIADCIDEGAENGIIRDPNGNTVGKWTLELEAVED